MPANIRDIDALRDFRAALIQFVDSAATALQSMLVELQRSTEWIDHERPRYWNTQLQRSYDRVSQARTALETCRTRTVAGRRPSCQEEQQAYRLARQRLQDCQDQLQNVRQWSGKLQHQQDEFRGRLANLQAMLDTDLPKAIALLARTITTLEAYTQSTGAEPRNK